MAERLLFGTVARIIETLSSLAAKEIGLLWGVQDEIQRLTNTVSKIKAVLLDAEEKQAEHSGVRRWLEKLDDALYVADDLLDAISTEALRREMMTLDKNAKQVRIFFSKSNQLAYHLKMARKLKAIRRRLDDINADRERFGLEERDLETRFVRNRDHFSHSFVRANAVIGREDDKKAVIDRLLDSSNVEDNVSILPIVGIGGLGKTILAQLIFNDDQIQKHFDLKMWVCVSDSFDFKNVVEKILESATYRKPEAVEMDTLAVKLKEKIDGKRYLLVLDDVWNEDREKWYELKEVLMGGARGSRILVTTRYEIVARIIGTVESYSLKGLDESASWSLFKQEAFEEGQEPENSSIVAVGKEIAKRCSGVPLALRTIGSLLGSKNPEAEWFVFKTKELSKISQNENDILPTLKLSYDQLPSHLKHCFAYCSLYPKGYEIEKSTLIKLWTALGFVKFSDQNRWLEDVGHEYFMDLHGKSLFQEPKMDEFGNLIGCKLHDLMHDLAMSVAGSLITTLYGNHRDIDEKTRHVSFGCDINISNVVPTLMYKASRIRTFLQLGGNNIGAEIDYDTIFSSFKLLRVLVMHKSNLDLVPSSIGKLKYLTYLDLSSNYNINKLPDSITRLQNLQTLRLSECGSLEELPRDIKKLTKLRHLEIDGCRLLQQLPRDIKKLTNLMHLGIDECYHLTYMPRGLGQLTNLHNLSRFVVNSSHSDSGGLSELSRLNNLRGKLVIENLEHGKGAVSEYKDANLKEKQHLNALHLWWSSKGGVNESNVAIDEAECFQPHPNLKYLCLGKYRGSRLPSWILVLTNLVRFELYWCKKCQYLPPLSQLPFLKYLLLIGLDAILYISEGGDSNEKIQFFPSLKEISLSNCHNLKGWWRRDSSEEHRLLPSFPLLSTLSISFCPMLTFLPMFPHLEEKLILSNASLEPLQQTMMMNMAAPQSSTSTATTSSSSIPLSKLKYMELNSIADLETLPDEWFLNLTSLKSLKIGSCNRLKSLPSELQHATTLQRLEISNCVNLMAIPESIHYCISLEVLEIRGCSSLTSLPEGMHGLTSLKRLTIVDCPILLQRCDRRIGEDWPKIAHIPELDLLQLPQ